jgi:peptidoglycan/xylan/chitin deacetylase (PgdA/CDA1 family)
MTADEIRWEMEQVNVAFLAQGYDLPTQHAYPYGGFDDSVKATVAEYRLGGRTVWNSMMTFPIQDWFDIKATELTETTTWDKITGLVEDCIANQTMLHMFTHRVSDSPGKYGCTPAKLTRFLDYLVEQQTAGLLEIVTMAEAYDCWSTAIEGHAMVVVSFDDANDSDYTIVYPLFQERGIKGTSYIVTGFIGKPGYLTWTMIEEMRASASSPPKPDLTMASDDFTFTPAAPEEGDTVTISASIHNVGDESAINVMVGFYDGPVSPENMIGTDTISTLEAGATAIATTVWTAVAGNYEIYVAADPEHMISESNENNNEASMTYILIISESNENNNETSKTLTVSSSGDIVYISSIDMALFTQWPFYRASALIAIMDDNKNPIVGATVYGNWSGLQAGNVNGVTDVNGQVALYSDKVRGSGTFTFTVTNVVKADWTYDPIQNGVTNNSITCPYVYVYRARLSIH